MNDAKKKRPENPRDPDLEKNGNGEVEQAGSGEGQEDRDISRQRAAGENASDGAETGAIELLEHERDELKDQFLRAKADLLNFQKRTRRDLQDARHYAIQDFARALLEVVDNFQRALGAADETRNFDNLRQGVQMTEQLLLDILKRHGVEAVAAQGEPFDPNLHEAIMEEARDDVPPGTVIDELVRGYTLKDRLLRPAVVRVSRTKDRSEGEDPAREGEENGSGAEPDGPQEQDL